MVTISKASKAPFRSISTKILVAIICVLVVGLISVISVKNKGNSRVKSFEKETALRRNTTQTTANAMTPRTSLLDRHDIPFLVYGTAWKKERTAMLVEQAILEGFRFIDTACQPKHYYQKGVGQGWTQAAHRLGLQRSDLYLQTKYTPYPGQDPNNVPYNPQDSLPVQVETSLKVSLDELQTDYLDTLVLHSPLDSYQDTMIVWRALERMVDREQVLHLGISNCYDADFFRRLYSEARIKPRVLQNRFYAQSNFDTELRAFCKAHGIFYQSFWTLTANRDALATHKVREWARQTNLTPQTLMFAFLLSLEYVTPLSGTTTHIRDDVELMRRLEAGEAFFENEDEQRNFAKILGMPGL